MTTKKCTAAEISEMLRLRHSGDQWAFLTEVPSATGTGLGVRRCDALAMSLWPSKGIYLHGYEIKVSRGDWLTEINDVSKATAFSRYCHYWWIAAPAGIVKLEELPETWGLMCPTATGAMRAKKPASHTKPELPPHSMLAGIFRAACKVSASEAALRAAREDGSRAAWASAKSNYERTGASDHRDAERRLEVLQKSVGEFEAASGIKIGSYGGKDLGELVRIIRLANQAQIQRRLENFAAELERTQGSVKEAITAARELRDGKVEPPSTA